MPWSKVSDAPKNMQSLDGVSLTLSQVNSIAKVADGIPEGQVDSPWGVAIAQFKKSHTVKNGKWVKKGEEQKEKEIVDFFIKSIKNDILSLNDSDAYAIVEKNASGTYNITTISTAALRDRDGETFTVKAIDYDIAAANKYGDFPEFRVFHSKHLAIGKVHKMARVGIFAVDSGESYDDPFSLSVCEKMLAKNDGRWRVSRGFKVFELQGACPECSSSLSISQKHMLAGFKCPGCDQVHMRFKGVLGGIRFTKARTFDITVTDVPSVPYTGAFAWRKEDKSSKGNGETSMNKKELKERLLDAGIPEDAINTRLKELTDDQIEELGDLSKIPDAVLLKEFSEDSDDDDGDVDANITVEFNDMIDAFRQVVRKEVEEAMDGFQVEIDGFDMEAFKESQEDSKIVTELKEAVSDLNAKVDLLLEEDEKRLKELLSDTSRSGKLRILRQKEKAAKKEDDEEEEEEEEDEDTLAAKFGIKKETLRWIQRAQGSEEVAGDQIVDAQGKVYSTMTEMVQGDSD